MVECTLATIDDYCMAKRPPIHEFRRQVKIAQTGIDWLRRFNIIIPVGERVFDVGAEHNYSVADYASKLRHEYHPDNPISF